IIQVATGRDWSPGPGTGCRCPVPAPHFLQRCRNSDAMGTMRRSEAQAIDGSDVGDRTRPRTKQVHEAAQQLLAEARAVAPGLLLYESGYSRELVESKLKQRSIETAIEALCTAHAEAVKLWEEEETQHAFAPFAAGPKQEREIRLMIGEGPSDYLDSWT